MMNYWLLLIPFIGAVVGWIIHSIAVSIFFRSLPKRQAALAQKIGLFAGQQLISFDGIQEKITNPENLSKILPLIEEHMDDFLHNRLKEQLPMISMFIGNKTIDSLKKVFMQEIEALLPKVLSNYTNDLKSTLNIEKIVTEKIATYPAAKIEETLKKEMAKELQSLKLLGAICGFIIGVIQIVLTLLLA